ncbi:bifunctional riboflavin kinase/FAD synthetase [Hoylesella pleuritidis]|uniref:bifunctional riboflavin kinase/FAD synthetase n=1 Tax=Hoylesella pleuritidis TaxID=407975 RepID=UPI000586B7A1|nr:bifunctional riboflavin kinase/FAD synthetase [Hoylesella pleuritidis]
MIIVDETTRPLPPAAATIGFFDGVHCGHRYLIGRVIDEARADGLASMVITFARHPRQVIDTHYVPRLLSTPEMKIERLAETGIDRCTVLDFDRRMAALTAREFMIHILSSRLNVRKLIIGYDNRFGHDRSESIDDYCAYGRTLGIEVVKSCGITVDGIRVSSSVIRNAIERGDLTEANRCLGYAYTLSAHVSHGFRNGHRLGFPTANLDMDEVCQLLPQIGVYATRVRIEGECELHPAMTSVGTRPTFDGTRLSVETYILDFDADLYGRKLEVAFLKRIRGEKKFADLQQLRTQMADDERCIRELNHL